MFDAKQKQLFEVKKTSTASANKFLAAAKYKAAKTFSGNMAPKFSTTDNPFVDQFGKMGSYKVQRNPSDIFKDISELVSLNLRLALCFTLFLRMITRIVSFFGRSKTTSVQRGAGLRHEGILRMMYFAIHYPDVFWKNIHLFISVGSWKDIIQMLSYDLQYNGWNGRTLDWDKFGKLLLAGLENPKTSNLIKKYLPQIKTNSKCTTLEAQADNMISKWICSLLFGSKDTPSNYKKYRKLKSSGTAHQWQQLISQGKHDLVDFNTVHGRALSLLVSSKYIENNGLEKRYEEWISTKPVLKFTGYVHELFSPVGKRWGNESKLRKYQIDTLNKQFMQLVETAKKGARKDTSLIVVRDTSSSMTDFTLGTNMSNYSVGKALALFFSYMLPEGRFADSWIEFANRATLRSWTGNTPFEKFINDRSEAYGGTNLQSVIDLFISIKQQGVPESEFPTGIICISDGEFNPTKDLTKTNVQYALEKLQSAGFSESYISNFQMIFWNLQSTYYGKGTGEKFETYGNVPNVFYFSGYDGSIVAFLTGREGKVSTPKTAEELFNAAMDQEIMSLVQV